jgi:hypothetical protein
MKEWIVAWFTVHERMLFEDGGISGSRSSHLG